MVRVLQRIGILLAIMFGLLLITDVAAIAAPKSSKGGDPPGQSAKGGTVEPRGSSQTNSGKGMNRQGGPGTHPGKGWKDPGQWQGSPMNTADPDCTGNRSTDPQDTNIGACDVLEGAPDKLGGSGGFDSDHDWNNGCGNDTDFEDDNNGLCGGLAIAGEEPEDEVEVEEEEFNGGPPEVQVRGGGRVRVLGGEFRKPPAPVTVLPVTGYGVTEMLLMGAGSIALGKMLSRKERRRKR